MAKKKTHHTTLYIDDRGVRLMICTCGAAGVPSPQLRSCPDCGQIVEVQLVSCADPYHNDPKGCKNPECWKYQK